MTEKFLASLFGFEIVLRGNFARLRGKLRFVAYANVGIDKATLNNLKQLSLLQRETIGQKREVCFVLLKMICRGIMLKETESKF